MVGSYNDRVFGGYIGGQPAAFADPYVPSSGTFAVTGAQTISGALTVGGALAVDDTTDSTSGTTGSIQTDGGLGIAKDLWVGVNANVDGVIKVADGTVSAAALQFGGDVDTGLYGNADATVRVATAGSNVATFSATGTTLTHATQSSGNPTALTVTSGAATNQTASTETTFALFNSNTNKTWAAGTLSLQRMVRMVPGTIGFGSSSTCTEAAVLVVDNPYREGSNSTIGRSSSVYAGLSASRPSSTNYQHIAYYVPASTVTLTGTTAMTAAPAVAGLDIDAITITDASAVTVSSAAAIYVKAAPVAAGSVTLTNTYAIWVDAGASRFDGDIGLTGSRVPNLFVDDITVTNDVTVDNLQATTAAGLGSDASIPTLQVISINHAFGEVDAAAAGVQQFVSRGETDGAISGNGELIGYQLITDVAATNNQNWTGGTGALVGLQIQNRSLASSTGVISSTHAIKIFDFSEGGATVTNQIGIYMGSLTTGDNNYGIDFGSWAVDGTVFRFVADAITTAGTVSHQVACDVGGTTYYLTLRTHGS